MTYTLIDTCSIRKIVKKIEKNENILDAALYTIPQVLVEIKRQVGPTASDFNANFYKVHENVYGRKNELCNWTINKGENVDPTILKEGDIITLETTMNNQSIMLNITNEVPFDINKVTNTAIKIGENQNKKLSYVDLSLFMKMYELRETNAVLITEDKLLKDCVNLLPAIYKESKKMRSLEIDGFEKHINKRIEKGKLEQANIAISLEEYLK